MVRNPIRKDVLEYLRQEILTGGYNYGERLIETKVAKHLNVSRTPVREAFRELEMEGLVTSDPGRGITVTRILDDIHDIYSIRGVLEGLAARLAARRRTPNEVKSLKVLMQRMARFYARRDYRAVVKYHTKFNEQLYQCARSKRLQELASRFHRYTERSQLHSMSVHGRFKAIQKEHADIVAAIADRDAGRAEKCTRIHVKHAQEAFITSMQNWGLLPASGANSNGDEKGV